MPPWIRGWSVFTRPPSSSGLPVSVSTSSTSRPAWRSDCAVPPEPTSSTPSSRSPRANSINPRLSDTESSARATGRVVASGGVMDASPRRAAGKGGSGGDRAEVYRGRAPASNTTDLSVHARSDADEELVRDRPGAARGLFHRQNRRAARRLAAKHDRRLTELDRGVADLHSDIVHRDAARDRAQRAGEPDAPATAGRDRHAVRIA